MADVKGNNPEKSESTSLQPLHFFDAAWLREASDAPAKLYSGLYRGSLDAASRQLREQADYLQKLSELKQPADAFACHGEFARKTLTNWIDESRRLFNQSLAIVTAEK